MKPGPITDLISQVKHISEQFRVRIDDCLPWSISKSLGEPKVRIYVDGQADFNELGAGAGIAIELNEDFISHDGDRAILHLINDEQLDEFIKKLEEARNTTKMVNRKLYGIPGISHLE